MTWGEQLSYWAYFMVFSLTIFFRYSLEHLFPTKMESLLSLGLHLNYKT